MNKPQAIALACTALMAGCASTPQDTLSTEPYSLTSKFPPTQYARCIIKNAENISGDFSGREEPGAQSELRKLIIRHSTGGASVIANIDQKDSGSVITLWISRNHIMRDTLLGLINKDC